MKTLDTRQDIGTRGEELATRYLQSHGWTILSRNWRCARGELDIVAFDPQRDAIIAVEVKTRTSACCGYPEEAVTAQKLQRIRKLFTQWLRQQNRRAPNISVDVIAITIHGHDDFRLHHIQDAA